MSASTTAMTSNIPPRRIHSTPIQSVSSILLRLSGGIWFIAYLTPKKQVLIEATKKNTDAQISLRDALLMNASCYMAYLTLFSLATYWLLRLLRLPLLVVSF